MVVSFAPSRAAVPHQTTIFNIPIHTILQYGHDVLLAMLQTLGWLMKYRHLHRLPVTCLLLFHIDYNRDTPSIVVRPRPRVTAIRRVWDPGIGISIESEDAEVTALRPLQSRPSASTTILESLRASSVEYYFHCLLLHTGTSYSQRADQWCTTRQYSLSTCVATTSNVVILQFKAHTKYTFGSASSVATAESSAKPLKPSRLSNHAVQFTESTVQPSCVKPSAESGNLKYEPSTAKILNSTAKHPVKFTAATVKPLVLVYS